MRWKRLKVGMRVSRHGDSTLRDGEVLELREGREDPFLPRAVVVRWGTKTIIHHPASVLRKVAGT